MIKNVLFIISLVIMCSSSMKLKGNCGGNDACCRSWGNNFNGCDRDTTCLWDNGCKGACTSEACCNSYGKSYDGCKANPGCSWKGSVPNTRCSYGCRFLPNVKEISKCCSEITQEMACNSFKGTKGICMFVRITGTSSHCRTSIE